MRAHPNIQLMERFNAVDLITTRKLGLPGNKVLGAYVWNRNVEQVEGDPPASWRWPPAAPPGTSTPPTRT